MKCEICGGEEASIQLTKVKDNEMKVLHLCEGCAAEEGVETMGSTTSSLPLADFLAQIGKSVGEQAAGLGRCPTCGLSPAHLKQTGRLGCATCYAHYDQHLRSLLRRLHGATQHVGKLGVAPGAEEVDRQAQVESLRRKLERAVEAEDFEHAAVLRDQIRRQEETAE